MSILDGVANPFPEGIKGSKFKVNLSEVEAMTRAEEKVLRRLCQLRPDLLTLSEPGPVDYGYIPVGLSESAQQKETTKNGNVYYLTPMTPATKVNCPRPLTWEQDAEYFEKEVKKGNFQKVSLKYTDKGKIVIIGPYEGKTVEEAPKEAPKADIPKPPTYRERLGFKKTTKGA